MSHPLKAHALEVRAAGNDVLVHDPAHGKVHVVNRTAGRVLDLCDGNRSVAEIARSIGAATGAAPAIVERDVAAVVDEFRMLQLVTEAQRGSPTT